jgi:hypothetical protein
MVVDLCQLLSIIIIIIITRHPKLFPRPTSFILSASKRVSFQTQCCHLVFHDVFDAQVFLLHLSMRGTSGRPTIHSGIRSETVDIFGMVTPTFI